MEQKFGLDRDGQVFKGVYLGLQRGLNDLYESGMFPGAL
jgi:hypothetical protein